MKWSLAVAFGLASLACGCSSDYTYKPSAHPIAQGVSGTMTKEQALDFLRTTTNDFSPTMGDTSQYTHKKCKITDKGFEFHCEWHGEVPTFSTVVLLPSGGFQGMRGEYVTLYTAQPIYSYRREDKSFSGRIPFEDITQVGYWDNKLQTFDFGGVFVVARLAASDRTASKQQEEVRWNLHVRKENVKQYFTALEILCPNLVR